MAQILDLIQHLPDYLHTWALFYGAGLYGIVALIIFCETGLVVTPFLPGDSLLFAVGAVLSLNLPNLDLFVMIAVLVAAALIGDTVNFHIGKWMAPRLFRNYEARWLNRKHLDKTRAFYDRHGGKTVILARFLPILRTYAPFVTGMSGMRYSRFVVFSFAGGVLWVSMFVLMGYFFGNLPGVKSNFHYAILAIVLISVAPLAYELLRGRAKSNTPAS
jgi:membrane-associated protein